jgi:2-polyprenyl-3-methyl-5-hydroxy-6-metoxy-1,4-benzoquinol methylase
MSRKGDGEIEVGTTESYSEIASLMDEVLQGYKDDPIDLLNNGGGEGEYNYLVRSITRSVETVFDIVSHTMAADRTKIRILEIGPFLGNVSVALARLGFHVTVIDLEEFISCKSLQRLFIRNGIKYNACNLREYSLPFDDESFDVVVMCATIEHLNFNPLPMVKEINRAMSSDGLLYVTCPNLIKYDNRMALLRGESILNPIDDYFAQYDPKNNMIAGLHWREYTAFELKEMFERMGFSIAGQTHGSPPVKRYSPKRLVKKFVHRFINLPVISTLVYESLFDPDDPRLYCVHKTFAVKSRTCDQVFHMTDVLR